MSTANTVVVSCLLDDGTGTFPIDISSQVSLTAGIDLSNYGRADESTSASAAELSLTVKNDDGSFTTGVGFGSGGFGSGFFGGVCSITKGQKIRFGLTVNGSYRNCFTGRIDSLSQSFEGAPGKRSDIAITAMDAMSDYGKRPMRSMLEQEILLDSPTAYYTLGEAEGSTSAGDTSGNGQTPLAIAGSGTAPTFGSGTGPVDGLTAATFAGGQYLQGVGPTIGTGTWSAAVFFNTSTLPTTAMWIASVCDPTVVNGRNLSFYIDNLGQVRVASVLNDAPLGAAVDGHTHCIVAVSSGGRLKAYLDGALVSDAPLISSPLTSATKLAVGWLPEPFSVGSGIQAFTGTVSHVALFDGIALSAARAASYALALTSFSETTAARISRLAAYAGTTAITSTPSGQLMPTQPTSGEALLDSMGAVADAELGVLYIDGSGQLRMQGRAYRTNKITADLSQTGKALEPDSTSVVDDSQQAINYMTVGRYNGATQTWPLLLPSVNLYPGSIDLVVDSDSTALAYAQWMVNKHSSPGPRLPSVTTTNLRTSASAAGLFAREIGDRLHLTGLPATTNPNLGDVTIEGYSMHLDRDTWTYTYNLLPWSLFQAATWNDATNSKWDTAVWAP